ncbi:hypothetical protein ARMGADRAFT_1087556 [Armillaria gallica]|uniref:HNH nuclease domain-containing protein n=1 Tax=Armillaria gallica TaxID=47427 RepID=A0A2H3CQN5_ARMGA|nr:hypothetical protein ARMGADRAFT_1087556 [Armillaria gallica]
MGAEGDLSFTPDSSSADFDYEEPFHSCGLYYHAHGPILLIDPDIKNASKPDHSDVDASPFGISIIEGDRSCVATHMKRSSCRPIGFRQAKAYIEAVTKGQGGDDIDDIDDPRNGLLVNPILHRSLGRDVAILQVWIT